MYGDEKIVLVEYVKPSNGHPLVWGGASVGIIAGFLYFFLRGRQGPGGRESGFGTGMPAPTAIQKDPARLTFVMVTPTADDPSRPSSFRGSDGKLLLLEELIARVKAGGRSDVALKIRGDVRAGAAASARARITEAGIKIWDDLATVGHSPERGSYR
jgi:hypothetical protein